VPISDETTRQDIEEFRHHFDDMYLGGIRLLLNEQGMFLAFLTMLTATEALAGAFAPHLDTGERFRLFVSRFFPEPLGARVAYIWQFRNLMVHSFNPGPFALVCNQSRLHLTAPFGIVTLNAEDFYAGLIKAADAYFETLDSDHELQTRFSRRLKDEDGGGVESFMVHGTNPIDGDA